MPWHLLVLAALVQAAPPAAPVTVPPPARQRPQRPEARIYRLFFDWDDQRVTGQGLAVLDQAVDDYHRNGRAAVEIIAGTDESGPNAYNQRLSERRARAVADGLVRRGIPRVAIRLRPMGIRRPLVATGNGIREPMNRYAEISFPEPMLR